MRPTYGLERGNMIYLASPYSSIDPQIMEERYLHVARETARLLNEHQIIYSPIVHCHELAKLFDLPHDFDFWQHYNLGMINAAKELWVLPLPGWDISKGVQAEIIYAQSMGKVVKFGEQVNGQDFQYR